jgi:DNA end-binding protein Ku
MRFAEELVEAEKLEVPEPSRAPSKREVEMASRLVDSLHGRFRPTAFKDTYRERVLDLIARKAKGEELELQTPEEPSATPDLIAALEASLGGLKSGSRRGTGSRSTSGTRSKSSTPSSSRSRSRGSKPKARS